MTGPTWRLTSFVYTSWPTGIIARWHAWEHCGVLREIRDVVKAQGLDETNPDEVLQVLESLLK